MGDPGPFLLFGPGPKWESRICPDLRHLRMNSGESASGMSPWGQARGWKWLIIRRGLTKPKAGSDRRGPGPRETSQRGIREIRVSLHLGPQSAPTRLGPGPKRGPKRHGNRASERTAPGRLESGNLKLKTPPDPAHPRPVVRERRTHLALRRLRTSRVRYRAADHDAPRVPSSGTAVRPVPAPVGPAGRSRALAAPPHPGRRRLALPDPRPGRGPEPLGATAGRALPVRVPVRPSP